MPVLDNARHEKFAQAAATGITLSQAYAEAGFAPSQANFSRLLKRPEIAARIEELKEKASQKVIESIGVTKEMIVKELKKLGFSNMLDYVTIGADGLPFCDFKAVDRDKGAAIQEVHVEESMRHETDDDGKRQAIPVRKVRFKLADKRAALVDMGKHLGMFNEVRDDGLGNLTLGDLIGMSYEAGKAAKPKLAEE